MRDPRAPLAVPPPLGQAPARTLERARDPAPARAQGLRPALPEASLCLPGNEQRPQPRRRRRRLGRAAEEGEAPWGRQGAAAARGPLCDGRGGTSCEEFEGRTAEAPLRAARLEGAAPNAPSPETGHPVLAGCEGLQAGPPVPPLDPSRGGDGPLPFCSLHLRHYCSRSVSCAPKQGFS